MHVDFVMTLVPLRWVHFTQVSSKCCLRDRKGVEMSTNQAVHRRSGYFKLHEPFSGGHGWTLIGWTSPCVLRYYAMDSQ